MNTRLVSMHRRLPIIALAVLAGGTAFATDAKAACFATAPKQALAAPARGQFAAPGSAQSTSGTKDTQSHHSIAGMWFAEFYKGTTTELWNQAFQLFHADNTEVSVDNAVPPSLGNVCVGVWKLTGARTIKLRHLTWNWNADGTLAGTFHLEVTLKLDRHGVVYRGTYVADSFDLSHNVIPELHAEGTVKGTRITMN